MGIPARRVRLSEPALRVLRVMVDNAGERFYGLDLMDRCGVKSGTLYPLMARLADVGWVVGEREKIDPVTAGRPARTYYRLTGLGAQEAEAALAALAPRPALGWAVS